MNTTEIKGNWNEQKGKLKQKFATLTDNKITYDETRKDEIPGNLHIKFGKSKEKFLRLIAGL